MFGKLWELAEDAKVTMTRAESSSVPNPTWFTNDKDHAIVHVFLKLRLGIPLKTSKRVPVFHDIADSLVYLLYI